MYGSYITDNNCNYFYSFDCDNHNNNNNNNCYYYYNFTHDSR